MILSRAGCSNEVIAAGILHDTLEDTELTAEEMKQHFGPKVTDIVQDASEPDRKASWEERKAHTIQYLREEAPLEVQLVACADKLDNARSIREGFEKHGEAVWKRFRRGRALQEGYYRGLVASLCHRKDIAG